ncbi:hypothetical protein ISN35_13950 [Xanthomonas translucens pv. undulosa]|nr:hypothetical protein ISN33_13490 [Xanthomonas translucens pv. translucens]QSQ48155.1 hypothetical protein ISN35_13950 [Xanthomonas translucens pv. undulosa]
MPGPATRSVHAGAGLAESDADAGGGVRVLLGLGTRDSGLGTRDSGLGTRDSGFSQVRRISAFL